MGRGDDVSEWLSREQKLSLIFLVADEPYAKAIEEADEGALDDTIVNTFTKDKYAKKFKEALQVVKTYADVKRLELGKYVETKYFKELVNRQETSPIKKLLLALDFVLNEEEIGSLVSSFDDKYETGLVPFLVKLLHNGTIELIPMDRQNKICHTCNVFSIIDKLKQHDRAQKLGSLLLEYQNETNKRENYYPIYDKKEIGKFLIINLYTDDTSKNKYVEPLRKCWKSLGFLVEEKNDRDALSKPIERARKHSAFGICILCSGDDTMSLNAVKQNLSKREELMSKPKIVIYCSNQLLTNATTEKSNENESLEIEHKKLRVLNDMITITWDKIPESIQELQKRVENIEVEHEADIQDVFNGFSQDIGLNKKLYLVKSPEN